MTTTPSASAEVVAVVPTLGGNLARLERCLGSLETARGEADLAVVVVWNDPRRPVPELGDVTVLEPGCNLGYSGSVLHARRRSSARFLWMLQDDMRIEPGCLRTLRARLDLEPDLAIVAPVIVDADGEVPVHSRGGVLAPDLTMDHWFPTERVRPAAIDTSHRLDWVASSGSLVRLDPFDEVGGIDPGFFPVAWGDVDLGYRLGRAGYRVAVDPEAHVRHDRNGSTPSVLARHVGSVNAERFRATASGGRTPSIDVDRDIADAILAAASSGLVDLAVMAQERDVVRDDELAGLRAELRAVRREQELLVIENRRLLEGRSMRITAPLRWGLQSVRSARERLAAMMGRS